ncbi:glycosyltransferase [Undibacterium sp. SXout20W]|uniref:glycosyltransferase n=1 Tax=Undibacterium sp. SXout20W TaxID=3413051 RepID=UPI003BF20217
MFNTETSPLISILVPLYNHEHYVEECLDSILVQGNLRLELLLIDDGSVDHGFEIASEWKKKHGDKFVNIFFEKQTNAGIVKTFDKLIRRSQGEFILILASDDVLLEGAVSARLKVFSDPQVMAVFGDAIPIDSEGIPFGKSAISELGARSSTAALADQRTLLGELIFRWNIYGSVLMSRRQALLNPDGTSVLNLSIYCEDMQLYYKLASEQSLKFINVPVAKYRVHESSASAVNNLKKIVESSYRARLLAMHDIQGVYHFILRMQAFTFHRWDSGLKRWLLLPLVATAYAGVGITRFTFDCYRKFFLKQRH